MSWPDSHRLWRYIDECFLSLDGLPTSPADIGRQIRERVARWIGLPVCVGIASTKTLAKLYMQVKCI